MVSWGASWSSLKNTDSFKAKDVSIGLNQVYAIDTSYNVWSYNISEKAWTSEGFTALKIASLGLIADCYVYITTSGDVKSVGYGIPLATTDTAMLLSMTTNSIGSFVDVAVG
jgi:hypothetical protein